MVFEERNYEDFRTSPLKTPDIGWWILKMVRPHPWCKKSVLNGGELLTFSMICDFQTAFCPTNLFLEIRFPTLLLWTHFSVGIWKRLRCFSDRRTRFLYVIQECCCKQQQGLGPLRKLDKNNFSMGTLHCIPGFFHTPWKSPYLLFDTPSLYIYTYIYMLCLTPRSQKTGAKKQMS